jgi:hypothetical protein
MQLTNSRKTVLLNPRIIQFGAPGCGKTLSAASISKHFPECIWRGEKPKTHVYLKDLLFIMFDNGGLDSLAEWNLSAPVLPYTYTKVVGGKPQVLIDPDHSCVSGPAIEAAVEQIGRDLPLAMVEHGIENVIVDTFSTLNTVNVAYQKAKYSAEKNQRRIWDHVLGLHLRFNDLLKSVRAPVVYNCHAKNNMEAIGDEKEVQEAPRLAAGIKIDGNWVIPEITGAAFRTYNALASLILPMTSDRVNRGGKMVFERKYHPLGYQAMTFKSRFQTLLDKEEPTNLRALLDKVRSKIHLLDEVPTVGD